MTLRGAGARTLLVLAVLGGASLAGAPAQAADGEAINRYDTRVEVAAQGTIRITETIAYDFGSAQRHGITRDLPARFHYDDKNDREYPISEVTVTMDGGPVAVDRSSSGGYQRLKIGEAHRTITGEHTYVIGYSVRGALNHFADHEELYWNTVGNGWTVPVRAATATVTGPAAPTQVACYAGPEASRLACESSTVDGDTATFRHSGLAARESLSVVVAYPVGSVANTGPILVERHDLSRAFRATPLTVGGGLALALLGAAGALLIGWRVGRDRRYLGQLPGLVPMPGEAATQARKPLFGKPPVSVEFVPPDNIRPGQVGTLIDEKADVLDVTATIVDFAVRRHLHITEVPATGRRRAPDWELVKVTDGDPKFLPYEATLFEALFHGRDRVRLSDLRNTFATDLSRVRAALYRDVVSQGWYPRPPNQTRAAARGLAAVALVGAILVTVVLAVFTTFALLGLGLVVGAAVLVAVAGKFPARTGRGSAALARVQGFRLYVATAEAAQIAFEERVEIFSRYLPYAIVFGLVDRWANTFARIGAFGPSGAPGLYWYTGQPGWSMLYFHQSIGAFTTTTAGTIATTPPSAAGGSGFSGGGFSGGGGGGGGGGSW